MFIGAQVSLYPMTSDFIDVIMAGLKALPPYEKDLRIETDDMSTDSTERVAPIIKVHITRESDECPFLNPDIRFELRAGELLGHLSSALIGRRKIVLGEIRGRGGGRQLFLLRLAVLLRRMFTLLLFITLFYSSILRCWWWHGGFGFSWWCNLLRLAAALGFEKR